MMADVPRRKPMPAGYRAQPEIQHPNMNTFQHSRTRTTSSSVFPIVAYPPQPRQLYPTTNMQVHAYTSRRTPSNATSSTVASSGNGPVPCRQSQDLRRSTSSRSGGGGLAQPGGYVALMRKQKATVWCDRAQYEDPRLMAAQKAAKIRAANEIIGGRAQGRLSTGSSSLVGSSSSRVTAKIRHHGKANLSTYSPGDLVGGVGGVPMRLSASEVEGGDSDDDADSGNTQQGAYYYHRRTGSGRSSLGSGRRGLTYSRQSGASSIHGRWSSGNTPPSERQDSMDHVAEAGETPVPGHVQSGKEEYFPAGDGTQSVGSGSSGERADGVPEMDASSAARLASNSLLKATITREKSVKNPEELRRRGSIDERTTTMTLGTGRLYIANPDADSD